MNIAERNRQIKKLLGAVYGRDKVRVRGSRGTGYGYVHVEIDWTPLDDETRRAEEAKCFAVLRAAKVDLGFAYTDDTCQYTTTQTHISFNSRRYFRTHRHSDGALWGQRHYHDDAWELVEEE